MKSVVHIIFTMEVGGAENMLVDLVNEQVRTARVAVIILNSKYNVELLARISPMVKILHASRVEGSWNPYFLCKLWSWLLNLRANIIHCHQHNMIRLLPFWQNKTVVTIHDVGVETKYLTKYRRVFAISAAVQKDLLRRGSIHSTLIHNGIQASNIKRKRPRFYQGNAFKIVQISRLVHEKKGQHLAIAALNFLKSCGYTQVQLYFIGKGPSADYLKHLAALHHLEGSIFFLGEKQRDWIYENLNQFDILLQPSLYEGFGLTIIEGLAAGLPVVASSVDGPAEILQDMPAGFLFEISKEGQLAQVISRVMDLNRQGKIEELCDNSRELVLQRYTICNTACKYMENYP